MSPSAQRTLIRLLALFIAAGAGDAVIQFITASTYDWRHLMAGLVVAAIMALEKWLSEQNPNISAPTTNGVSVALQNQSGSVPPPTIAINPTAPRLIVSDQPPSQ